MDESANPAALIERDDGFAYGYLMRCTCGGVSPISGAEYYTEMTRKAHMPCQHCKRTIHFGPAVAALRDPEDPALDNERINQLAWYHTSTAADWPSATYVGDNRAALLESARRFHLNADRVVELHLNKALHVGTYEAAIENMLRRMQDQGDAESTFYLHRVATRIDPSRINAGYRDENDEPAAQVTNADLCAEDLEAIRYLDVHEAIGSLSLAVLPETIASVQTIALPVDGMHRSADPSITRRLEDFDARLVDLAAERPDTAGIDPRKLNLMSLGLRPDPDRIGARSTEHGHVVSDLWRDIEDALADYYLPDVSPVVVGDLKDAVGHWYRSSASSARQFADRFAAYAALLTYSQEIREVLARQPVRHLSTGG